MDFMVYTSTEFKRKVNLMLQSGAHYFYLSSARVFADSPNAPIVEDSSRHLDVSKDEEYLRTDEYALSKAREEDMLSASHYDNWTVIRPYITYAENRLQLGVLEKEEWLYRALKGRAIVFCEEMLDKRTTLTYGADVSRAISLLIREKAKAKRESFNITTSVSTTWREVLELYLDVIYQETGKRPKVKLVNADKFIKCRPFGRYQVIYDRLYNRKFDNSKIENVVGPVGWLDPRQGLEKCLKDFLKQPSFLAINWPSEVIKDKMCGQFVSLSEIPGWRKKLRYFINRFK